ncbi:hypothetical protein CN680_11820 [Bacillus pseudomycoides]|nr:hypothetical protein CON97_01605 [Bacillus pseudomycoides]PEI38692.1 hypothetical protein CN620_20930 [Bacillus pseudomycoides]PEJ78885.1 hypothetical protein CN680_11820 [Bacillus pseudomycoides]PEM17903.1 hypothetical protein CN628_08810 [Bacillus pseudomycoides]PEP02675.1 hypothetical protein CN550_06015 [Bacillus pseudomycoides]
MPLFVFTWHGAGKGSDRFYAWPVTLSHQKRKVFCRFFNLYLYKLKFPSLLGTLRDNPLLTSNT